MNDRTPRLFGLGLLLGMLALTTFACDSKAGPSDDVGEGSGGDESGQTGGDESAQTGDDESAQTGDDESAQTGAIETAVTWNILNRDQVTGYAVVEHVLISWSELADSFRGAQDPRGAARSRAEADVLALAIMERAAGGEDFHALMLEFSEDPGSAETGSGYDVVPEASLVPSFKNLALRLNVGEVGICESSYGYHIMLRIPTDEAASADILNREPLTDTASVQHILLSHQGNASTYILRGPQDERGRSRTIEDARVEVTALLERVRAGEDFEALMAEFSEDPDSATTGRAYDITPGARLASGFKVLGTRLNVGEAGVIPTEFGFHIILRTR